MTRRSKRELETAVDDLAGEDPRTFREWLRQYVVNQFGNGEIEITAAYTDDVDREPPGDDETVVYVDDDGQRYSIPTADLPAWVDVEDLPLHGPSGSGNPFVLADFSETNT